MKMTYLRYPVLNISGSKIGKRAYHGLYGSTSSCISHGPSQWERAIFDPPQLRDPRPISMKFEIYKYFPDTTRMQNFRGATSTWVVFRLRNDLYCVEWGVKLYSLTRLGK